MCVELVGGSLEEVFVEVFCPRCCLFQNYSYLCDRFQGEHALWEKGFFLKTDGAIAQLVEQRTENPCVPGSIPGGTTHVSFISPMLS